MREKIIIIKEVRSGLVRNELSLQNRFISDLAANGLGDKEKYELILSGSIALGIMDWVTRHTEENFFHSSVYYLHKRHTAQEYRRGVGGPLQAKLMDTFGVSASGKEPVTYLLQRILVKNGDRIELSRERTRRFTRSEARELEGRLRQDARLQEMYGNIDFRGRDMVRPYNLNILYRNFVVLNALNSALNTYGKSIVRQREKKPDDYVYLRMVLVAREYLLAESGEIIGELHNSYSRERIIKHLKEGVEEDMQKRKTDDPQFFQRITGYGPISNGWRHDTTYAGRLSKRWGELDKDAFRMAKTFEDVVGFRELFGVFSNEEINRMDLKKGAFGLATIGGLTDALRFKLSGKPYRSG